MKLFFGVILGIFAVFITACIAGFFMPASMSLERSTIVSAHEEDIFPYMSNLKAYASWSALDEKLDGVPMITGGADSGVGQTQAWQKGPKGYELGSREIVQLAAPEFVHVHINIGGQDTKMTYALFINSNNSVTVLTKRETEQPGFPYIGRLRALITKGQIEADMDKALDRLKVQVEANL